MNEKFKDCLRSTIGLCKRGLGNIEDAVAEGFVDEDKVLLLSEELLEKTQHSRLSKMLSALNHNTKNIRIYIFLRSLAWQVLHNDLEQNSISSYFSDPATDKLINMKVEHIIRQACEYQIEKSKSIKSLNKCIEIIREIKNDAISKALRKSIKMKYLYFDVVSDNKLIDEAQEIKDSESIVSFIGYKFFVEKISDFFKRINSFLSKKAACKNPKLKSYLGISDEEISEALQILKDFQFNGQHKEKFSKLLEECLIENKPKINDEVRPEVEINLDLKVAMQPAITELDYNDLSRLPVKSIKELNEVETIYAPEWSNVLVLAVTMKSDPAKKLALKIVKNSKFNIFKNQAIYMNKMKDHKNFLSLYGVFEDIYQGQNCCCIVMEYCEMTLKDFFETKQFTDLPIENRQELTYKFVITLINAFHCLNLKGITHKDIKPQNILITFDEQGEPLLKVADFDVSSDYTNVARNAERAHVTVVVGTEQYAAPEVLKIIEESKTKENRMKKIEASLNSVKADVYSLGLTCLQMAVKKKGKIFGLNRLQEGKKSKKKLKRKVEKVLAKSISHEKLKSLLTSMLVVNPKKRKVFGELLKDFYVDDPTFKNEFE